MVIRYLWRKFFLGFHGLIANNLWKIEIVFPFNWNDHQINWWKTWRTFWIFLFSYLRTHKHIHTETHLHLLRNFKFFCFLRTHNILSDMNVFQTLFPNVIFKRLVITRDFLCFFNKFLFNKFSCYIYRSVCVVPI